MNNAANDDFDALNGSRVRYSRIEPNAAGVEVQGMKPLLGTRLRSHRFDGLISAIGAMIAEPDLADLATRQTTRDRPTS